MGRSPGNCPRLGFLSVEIPDSGDTADAVVVGHNLWVYSGEDLARGGPSPTGHLRTHTRERYSVIPCSAKQFPIQYRIREQFEMGSPFGH